MIALTCGVLLASLTSGYAPDRLRTILDAHIASVAAVRTVTCKLTFHAPPRGRADGLYRRSDGDYLLKVDWADGQAESLQASGGRLKGYSRATNRGVMKQSGSLYADTGTAASSCNPYCYGLLHFYGQEKFRSPLAEILAEPSSCKYIGPVMRDGRTLERVDVSHARADQFIDFDPATNYLARAVIVRPKIPWPAGVPIPEQEVTEFVEAAPGVYFPAKARSFDPATGKESWAIELTDIRVNQPVPADALTFRFPAGLEVTDGIRGGVYRTDANGEPTQTVLNSEGRPMQLVPGGPNSGVLPEDTNSRPSQSEAPSPSRYILPAAVALLVAGIILALIRRVRARRDR